MSKHTPGPWTVHHSMRDCVTFEGKNGTENLFMQNLGGYFACQNKYDARLIAAAPELLEALKGMADHFWLASNEVELEVLKMAKMAIAKAEGNQ